MQQPLADILERTPSRATSPASQILGMFSRAAPQGLYETVERRAAEYTSKAIWLSIRSSGPAVRGAPLGHALAIGLLGGARQPHRRGTSATALQPTAE